MLHLQNTRTLRHMPWSEVLTAITGVTGHAIVRAIVAGERDPVKLAQLRNPACQSSADRIAKALSGMWRERELKHLSCRATPLGYTLIPVAASHPAPAP